MGLWQAGDIWTPVVKPLCREILLSILESWIPREQISADLISLEIETWNQYDVEADLLETESDLGGGNCH